MSTTDMPQFTSKKLLLSLNSSHIKTPDTDIDLKCVADISHSASRCVHCSADISRHPSNS
jgi:hypothetical protein